MAAQRARHIDVIALNGHWGLLDVHPCLKALGKHGHTDVMDFLDMTYTYCIRYNFQTQKKIERLVEHNNNHGYHKSLDNLTPFDVYFGRKKYEKGSSVKRGNGGEPINGGKVFGKTVAIY